MEMTNLACPMKVEAYDNSGRWCIKYKCAWWVNTLEFDVDKSRVGKCAVKQIAETVNCDVKIHGR